MSSRPGHGIALRRTASRGREIEEAGATLGDRVGIGGVLGDLNREAVRARIPSRSAEWGFRWGPADDRSRRWWPQGITTAPGPEERRVAGETPVADVLDGRRLLITSWYAKPIRGENRGSRLSLIDLGSLEYRHVLLVVPTRQLDGRIELRPLRVHAGGLSWAGPYLHVSGTRRGLYSCRLADLMRVHSTEQTFGYRYVLPVRFRYAATELPEAAQMRYSFLSLDRGETPAVVVGEYGRDSMSRRLARFGLDPSTWHLAHEGDGISVPETLTEGGPGRMQGAVVVDGTWYVTTSRGPHWPGTLHVGRPGYLRRYPLALPVGPEDIDHDPVTNLLWSVTEYPGRRYVFCLPRTRFTAT